MRFGTFIIWKDPADLVRFWQNRPFQKSPNFFRIRVICRFRKVLKLRLWVGKVLWRCYRDRLSCLSPKYSTGAQRSWLPEHNWILWDNVGKIWPKSIVSQEDLMVRWKSIHVKRHSQPPQLLHLGLLLLKRINKSSQLAAFNNGMMWNDFSRTNRIIQFRDSFIG